jgi:uncharacterized protein
VNKYATIGDIKMSKEEAMQLTQDKFGGTYHIKSYEPGKVGINNEHYQDSLIIMPEKLITPWRPKTFAQLCNAHFECLLAYEPAVVIIGTGANFEWLDPVNYCCLIEKQIAVECMDSAAACRTYTVLNSESRSVAVALILD